MVNVFYNETNDWYTEGWFFEDKDRGVTKGPFETKHAAVEGAKRSGYTEFNFED